MSAHHKGRRSRFADRSGFTLIEVLVAFTVMATLLAVLYRGVVVIRHGAVAFDDHTDRALVARAVIDEALGQRTLKSGIHHGIHDGLRWTLIAKTVDLTRQLPPPAETDDKTDGAKPGEEKKKPEWATQRLLVRIEAPGRPLEIETLRMIRAE